NKLKNSDSLAKDKSEQESDTSGIRKIGAKTFRLQSGVWTDTEYKPDSKLPEISLKFGSREYFDLAIAEPELARYFSLGEKVIVVFSGR
ncbi:hypothetical protein OFB63_32410, partial [Escherichia coli]|nr:hypothetical protein [Escherichia coli]